MPALYNYHLLPVDRDPLRGAKPNYSGHTPTSGMRWEPLVLSAKIHDLDTFRGHSPFLKSLHFGLFDAPIRSVGFDGCEVNRVDKSKVITDAELVVGRAGLATLLAEIGDGELEIALIDSEERSGRFLAWFRIVHKKVVTNLAEWVFANNFDRSQLNVTGPQ
jgi:hypothetical protein